MNRPTLPIVSPIFSRRHLLRTAANGFGAVALGWMAAEKARAAAGPGSAPRDLSPRKGHHAPRVRNVIFLYMDGGPSQVDTFDPKPRLQAEHGRPFGDRIEPTQFNNIGNTLGSPWKFRRHGESGLEISELFPNIARHADKMCVIRSMTSRFNEHTNANYFLHTGIGIQGRPSMGAWVAYGLGSECRNLPAFVVLNGGLIPPGGLDNFNSGFLPATYQGSIFRPGSAPVANIHPLEKHRDEQIAKLDLLRQLDAQALQRQGADPAVEAAITNHELAFRMQMSVPEATDLASESPEIRRLYGLDSPDKGTATYAAECLMARRLVERGVRFVELTCPHVGHDRWDQHGNLKKGHEDNARAVDQPVAALISDLEQRGLLEETLVVWAGEFGRTPFAQGQDGRDHNPYGFSVWMAGGGVRGGMAYGRTDDYGYKVVENRLEMHDLHATMLHLLGVDHEKSTYRFSGRDMRLTDVHGHVIHDILS